MELVGWKPILPLLDAFAETPEVVEWLVGLVRYVDCLHGVVVLVCHLEIHQFPLLSFISVSTQQICVAKWMASKWLNRKY